MSLIKLRLVCWVSSLGVQALCGCASYGSHLTATPVAPDAAQASVHADTILMDRGFGPQFLPNPELGFRLGYSDDVDFGGRVNFGGGELNTRLRFVNAPLADITMSPFLGGGFVPMTNRDTGILRVPAGMRLLFGFHASSSADLLLGLSGAVEAQAPLLAVRGHTEDLHFLLSPGCSIGAEFPWGTLKVHPEVNLTAPYDPRDRSPDDSAARGFQNPIIQAGIAFKWNSL